MKTVYDLVAAALATDNVYLEEAVLVLDARQTADERQDKQTRHLNGRGWSYLDAEFGGSLANWIRTSWKMPGNRLTPKQREVMRKVIRKYTGQLIRAEAERLTVKAAAAA